MNEPRHLFFIHSTAPARCFPAWHATFSRLELARGLTMVMSSRSALFLRRGWLSKGAPPPLLCQFVEGSICRFVPLSEGPCVFNDKPYFAFAKGCLVEHSILGERASSHLCAGYSVKAGGLLPATIATIHPTDKFRRVMRSQAPAYVCICVYVAIKLHIIACVYVCSLH